MAELVDYLLKQIAECLECSICQDIFTDSVTLFCGHSYCMKCISEYMKRAPSTMKNCPKCRFRIKKGAQFKKNVTLCEMSSIYNEYQRFLSNEESTGYQTAMEVCDVSLQTSASLECDDENHTTQEQGVCDVSLQTSASLEYVAENQTIQEQAEAPGAANVYTSVEVTQGAPKAFETPPRDRPSSSSTHRHRAADISPPLPDATFARLTLSPALGHRRLVFKGRTVSTRRASSAHHNNRFDISQWMAEEEYSQGCYYWDVDASESVGWAVGVAYPNIGPGDQLGRTPSSWCLEWSTDRLSYWHNGMEDHLKHGRPDLVRVVLDMSNGTLSFYGLSACQTLLHCVQETFSGPVRPVFWLYGLKVPNALSFPDY